MPGPVVPHFPTLRPDRPTEQHVRFQALPGPPSSRARHPVPHGGGPALWPFLCDPGSPHAHRNPVLVSFQVDPVFTREVKAGVRRYVQVVIWPVGGEQRPWPGIGPGPQARAAVTTSRAPFPPPHLAPAELLRRPGCLASPSAGGTRGA